MRGGPIVFLVPTEVEGHLFADGGRPRPPLVLHGYRDKQMDTGLYYRRGDTWMKRAAAAPSSLIDRQGYQGGRGEEEEGTCCRALGHIFPAGVGSRDLRWTGVGRCSAVLPTLDLRETKDPQGLRNNKVPSLPLTREGDHTQSGPQRWIPPTSRSPPQVG